MCDHCSTEYSTKCVNINGHCKDLYEILNVASNNDIKLTGMFKTKVYDVLISTNWMIISIRYSIKKKIGKMTNIYWFLESYKKV